MMRCQYCGKPFIPKNFLGRTIYIRACNCLEKKEQEKEIHTLIEKANFPAETLDIIFGKHPLIKFNYNDLVASVKKYATKIKKFLSSRTGLFLIGSPGVGKTLSLVYLAVEIIKRYKKGVKFATAEDITISFYSFDLRSRYEKYKNAPILIIDDIIPQKWNMFDILNYRTNNYKTTFMSSNYGFQEISQYFGPAVMSRIKSKLFIDNITDTKDKRRLVV